MRRVGIKIWLSMLAVAVSACSTETIDGISPSENSETETYSISFNPRLGSRAGENPGEGNIENLYFVFHYPHRDEYRVSKASEIRNSGLFNVSIEADDNGLPDRVITVANYNGKAENLKDIENVTTGEIGSSNCLLMSTCPYFDTDGRLIYYTSLQYSDFLEGAFPVDIMLERVAAKISVNIPSETLKIRINNNARETFLTFHPQGWDVCATDSYSYVLKNTGVSSKEEMEEELREKTSVEEWLAIGNDENDGWINWSHSPLWDVGSFPKPGEEEKNGLTYHPRYSNIKYKFNSSGSQGDFAYLHESTRNGKNDALPNSKPLLVVKGYYTLDIPGQTSSSNAATLYREGNFIFTEDDYWREIAERQVAIFTADGRKPSAELLRNILEAAVPDVDITGEENSLGGSYVSPRLRDEAILDGLIDFNGNNIEGEKRADVNKRLYASCGVLEKYSSGMVFYLCPLRHFLPVDGYEGTFGVVRNNHYNINITGLSSIGHGVLNENEVVGERSNPSSLTSYSLIINVSILPWTEVPQTGDILSPR